MIIKASFQGSLAQFMLLLLLVGHQIIIAGALFLDNADKLSLLHTLHLTAIFVFLLINYFLSVSFKKSKSVALSGVSLFLGLAIFGVYQMIRFFLAQLTFPFVPGLLLFSIYSIFLITLPEMLRKRLALTFLKKPYRSLLINYIISCIIVVLLQIAAFFQFESLVLILGICSYIFILLDQVTRTFKIYVKKNL